MSFVPNGLARAAVRFKPAAFVGTFVALMMASLIVSACGILLETGLRASVPPARYADAPVVAAADQRVHYGSGDSASTEPVPDRARLDGSLLAKAAAVPGARTAVADVTFPVALAAKGGDKALTAHGWGATAFTGEKLTAGRAPAAGEAVLAGTGARVGDRVTLTTADGPRHVRVSGTVGGAAGPTVWFSDADAVRASGHPGRVDAIAVLPKAGVTDAALESQVAKALGDKAKVYTGEDRGGVEDPSLVGAEELLTGLGGSFGGIAALVAVFTAAGTVALSVGQRAREFALLRAIGTTPRQVRRTIATETLLVAPLAGVVGCLPGIALASWWFGQLKDRGAVPEAVDLAVSWIPLLVAAGTAVLTALFAGYLAARRPSRIKPGQALSEASVERLRPGWIRTPLGVAATVGGIVLSRIAATATGDDAANAALGVVMLFMLAVALLGPLVARGCAGLFGLPLRGAGASASLAAANSRSNARRLASAITPIVLAMAFASTLVFMHTSEDKVAADQQRDGITADHIVTSDAGFGPGAVREAAEAPEVTSAVGLLKTSVLIPMGSGGDRWLQTASAQGVTGSAADLAEVQDLNVKSGELTLREGEIGLDANLATSAHLKTGDRVELRLPDGTKIRPTVAATYERGLGLSQVTLPAAEVRRHVTAALDTEIWTKGGTTAALRSLGTVEDRDGYTAAQSLDRQVGAWANRVMAAVLGGFAAVAAVNTLVMTVLDRRRELGMLRLIGSTRGQIMRMIRWEALLVTGAGVIIGTAIALATLVPMMKGLTGESPYIPPLLYASFAGSAVLLGLLATALPARAALRASA
ncbi:ABC transporter permease [Streptomyces spectabilis]|uniref:ABC transporter permease n=1 Tax=Streptomyces spectabilis TaxID=68270 RepID=A0A5P2X4S8_STRST|nr:FtsX-like permease family protein [Streptomyces spectabilis]MBB5109084.1 putative ABC transport system permease protein [Streptomyces spectabilis]MCI3902727.1 ABC transporter permease [Streptomyces spectabilis]QEV60027.1 ABC transporter permease [Streptomyces spectabilis]GGV44608.1 ABC transporter permease [Streptomyces spectabilis]